MGVAFDRGAIHQRTAERAGHVSRGRYKITAGLYGAARLDHLGFSEVTGSAGRATWDAAVSRVEVGGGYSIQRNLVFKLSYQHNSRDTAKQPMLNFVAAQLVFWL